jgi:hypothetical protein
MPGSKRRLARLVAAGSLLVVGCGEVKTEQLLPWFKIEATHHPSIGGLADARTVYASFVKRHGFWTELENCDGGQVLNPDVVALSCSDGFHRGTALVRKGETVPRSACGSFASVSLILPGKDAVDCFDVRAGRAPVVPTQLGMRRVDLSGRELMSATLSVDLAGRVFLGPIPRFYDDGGAPYFVTYADQSRDAPDCALLALENGALKPVAAAPQLSVAKCYEPRAWSQLTGLTLRDSLGREESPAIDIPASPQPLKVKVR